MMPNEPNDNEEAAALQEKVHELEDVARKLGLYIEQAAISVMPDRQTGEPKHVLLVNMAVGEVAWSQRIQAPEEDQIATRFREIEAGMDQQAFQDVQDRMKRNIDAGRDPLDDGDDADDLPEEEEEAS